MEQRNGACVGTRTVDRQLSVRTDVETETGAEPEVLLARYPPSPCYEEGDLLALHAVEPEIHPRQIRAIDLEKSIVLQLRQVRSGDEICKALRELHVG